ncbi:hypothetical protein ONS95_013659 [Cadophora gregata]|uniref:uncharacterized protein n=1 Tax=Cadophora gregata TaxID=51156 RepID=UPI0026DA8D35|nr:uncharacterized protein ONS95_013659 [Cadophora gregata]KAK0114157.1 hypothetical protein ONS95_013659 [Cadophora gregata]
MLAQLYGNVLYQTAAILITTRFLAAVGASPAPAFGDAAPIGSVELLGRTTFPTSIQSPECQTLFVGQKATDGEVCLSVQDQSLIVEYMSVTDFSYDDVHVWVGVGTPPTTAPGQFSYTSGNGYCEVAEDGTSATCTIPFIDLPEGNLCNTELSIATHAALGGETGWGDGTCIQEDCHPWAMYSTFQFECTKAGTLATTTMASISSSIDGSTSSKPMSNVLTNPVGTSTTYSYPGTTKTKTSIITYTITSCPASKPCHLVTTESTVTYHLTQSITVPCETSTYVDRGSTITTTITKLPIAIYVTCPPEPPPSSSPTTSAYASATPYYNSSILIATEMSSFLVGPAKTYESVSAAANSTAPSAFTAGAPRLSRSLGCIATVVAMMGALTALMYM